MIMKGELTMSNRRKIGDTPEPNPVTDLIASLDGAQIPGGCGQCDAYQVVRAHAYGYQRIHMIEVHHDDWCPVLARTRSQRPA